MIEYINSNCPVKFKQNIGDSKRNQTTKDGFKLI